MTNTEIIVPESSMLEAPQEPSSAPRWALEVYDGSEKDLSDWLLAIIYQDVRKKGGDKPMAEAIAEACMRRLQVTHNLKDAADRATILQLWEAQKTAWWQFLPQHYGSVREILEDALTKATEKQAESEIYDLAFWTDTLLPALEYLSHPVDQIIRIPAKFSKARAAVPLLRKIWREMDTRYRNEVKFTHRNGEYFWQLGAVKAGPFPDQKTSLEDYRKNFYQGISAEDLAGFGDKLKGIIDGIVDDTSVRAYREQIAVLAGRVADAVPAARGQLIILGPDEEWIVLRGTTRQAKLIEARLGNLVSGMMPTDYVLILDELHQHNKNERREVSMLMEYNVSDHQFRTTGEFDGAIEMPRPGEMRRLALTAAANAYPYIVQSAWPESRHSVQIPIWDICPAGTTFPDSFLHRFNMSANLMSTEAALDMCEGMTEGLVRLYQAPILDGMKQILPEGFTVSIDIGRCGLASYFLFANVTPKKEGV